LLLVEIQSFDGRGQRHPLPGIGRCSPLCMLLQPVATLTSCVATLRPRTRRSNEHHRDRGGRRAVNSCPVHFKLLSCIVPGQWPLPFVVRLCPTTIRTAERRRTGAGRNPIRGKLSRQRG